MLRRLFWTAAVLAAIGAGLVGYALTLPIYTKADAPEKLSSALETLPNHTRAEDNERFKEWYTQLQAFETPHKRYSDIGRGLLAAGAGLGSAALLFSFYRRYPPLRKLGFIFLIWMLLWGIKVPLTFWYYGLREARFDYPIWGDSIAIPIVTNCMMWGMGAVISSIFLLILSIKRTWPDRIEWIKPQSFWGWTRLVILAVWATLMLFCIMAGLTEGDEGMVFPCIVAEVILLLLACAPEKAEKELLPER